MLSCRVSPILGFMEKTSHRAGGIVVNPKGEVALVGEDDTLRFPKGGVENGEDYFATAKREVLEETGIKSVELVKELGSYQRYPHGIDDSTPGAYPMTIHMFLFETRNVGEIGVKDDVETGARWVPVSEVSGVLLVKEDRGFWESIIEDILARMT